MDRTAAVAFRNQRGAHSPAVDRSSKPTVVRQNGDGSFPPRPTDEPIHWVVHVPGVLPLFDGDGIRPGDTVEVLRRGPDTASWRRFFRQRARTAPLRNPTV